MKKTLSKKSGALIKQLLNYAENNWRGFVYAMKSQGFAEHEVVAIFDQLKQEMGANVIRKNT